MEFKELKNLQKGDTFTINGHGRCRKKSNSLNKDRRLAVEVLGNEPGTKVRQIIYLKPNEKVLIV